MNNARAGIERFAFDNLNNARAGIKTVAFDSLNKFQTSNISKRHRIYLNDIKTPLTTLPFVLDLLNINIIHHGGITLSAFPLYLDKKRKVLLRSKAETGERPNR